MGKWILAVILAVMIGGCAHGIVENGYDAISTANYTVVQTMEYLGSQHCAGKITNEQKDQIIKYYEQYKIASDLADESLAIYSISKTESAKEAFLSALAQVDLKKIELIEFVNIILNNEGAK